jgi:chlorobactene glucosyltransferase
MYHGFREAVNGFSKNIIEYFGGNSLAMILFAVFSVGGLPFVYFGLSWLWALFYLGLNLLLSAIVSLVSRQSVVQNLVLYPLHKAVFLWIGFTALKKRYTHSYYWKGRRID